jgi:hypothetical protein
VAEPVAELVVVPAAVLEAARVAVPAVVPLEHAPQTRTMMAKSMAAILRCS